jgi:hypothetical protein
MALNASVGSLAVVSLVVILVISKFQPVCRIAAASQQIRSGWELMSVIAVAAAVSSAENDLPVDYGSCWPGLPTSDQ